MRKLESTLNGNKSLKELLNLFVLKLSHLCQSHSREALPLAVWQNTLPRMPCVAVFK